MVSQDLPPEVSQYLGPAFTPLVAILWNVVGVPVCEFVLLIYSAMALSPTMEGVGKALGELLAAVLGVVLILVLACIGIVLLVVVAIVFFTGLAGLLSILGVLIAMRPGDDGG